MLWFVLIGFAVGAALGSFAGCAAWRIPRQLPLGGRSRCPGCGERVPWQLNLPVVSFLVLRGRAACCGGRLAWRYLLLETVFAGGGAAAGVWSAGQVAAGWPLWTPFVVLAGLVVLVVGAALALSALGRRRG